MRWQLLTAVAARPSGRRHHRFGVVLLIDQHTYSTGATLVIIVPSTTWIWNSIMFSDAFNDFLIAHRLNDYLLLIKSRLIIQSDCYSWKCSSHIFLILHRSSAIRLELRSSSTHRIRSQTPLVSRDRERVTNQWIQKIFAWNWTSIGGQPLVQ